ncbi:uncharacterized protein N7459_002889 [Penicillium hispanicum]|uniref:uncharacterized protein n=1 Tax=Penicillium hispanicum TaxID=1080232 RepID=UPI00253F6FF8|nr:uncharacterized protein N7459_002889 [Penicillium hispanicum]KAJ5587124.1 hypothetical protein N7459_002889 [Penicillium hispanicum]
MPLNIFRRLRRSKKATPSQDPYPFWNLGQLAGEKLRLEQELQESMRIIDALKAQLAEYDVLLAHAQCQDMDQPLTPVQFEQPSSPHTGSVSPRSEPAPIWISDIWRCVNSNIQCLQNAEREWQEQRPQLAMEIIFHAISTDPFLAPAEEIRCRLFVAAVLHFRREYRESNNAVDMLLELISGYSLFDTAQSKDLAGIAHFIRGRNLMELEDFIEAYLSFSRALCAPGYYDKAREYQRQTITDFTLKEAANDRASIASSLRPLLSRDDIVSSVTNCEF